MKYKENIEMTVKFDFGNENNSLFDLGYIAIDLYHLIVFSELLENNGDKEIESLFLNKNNLYSITRESTLLKKYRDRAIVKSVRNGSIELVIAGVSVVAPIIASYIIYKKQKKDLEESHRYYFEISTNDEELNKLLNDFKAGYYGKGIDSLQWLLDSLSNRGYDITMNGNNAFVIKRVVERYERRMVKILDNI